MKEMLVGYGSMSGKTEAIADLMEEELVKDGLDVKGREVYEIDGWEVVLGECIMFGGYRWGDGEVGDDFLDLYDE
ncbi:flavodoxin domain-containing protein, partial [Priestia megaterium]|uniref:flavodoxin domain-containing protein n=1 Tax=Priestia megaterium TaxID=1404 RepID=UPI0012B8B11B